MYTPIKRTANDSLTHLKRRIAGLERQVAYYQSEYGEMKLEKEKAEAERDATKKGWEDFEKAWSHKMAGLEAENARLKQHGFYGWIVRAKELQTELAKVQRILEIERNSRHDFCPDCRDKVKQESCLRCQKQSLEAELADLKEETTPRVMGERILRLQKKQEDVVRKLRTERDELRLEVVALRAELDVTYPEKGEGDGASHG